jgi:hypothetical protein
MSDQTVPTMGTQEAMRVMWVDIEKLEFLTDAEGNLVNLGGDVGDTTPIQASLRVDTTTEKTGLVQPLEVTEEGPSGKHRIKDGARRATAIRQVVGEWNKQLGLLKKKGKEKHGDEIAELTAKVGVLRRVPCIVTGGYDDVDSIVDRQVAQFTTKQRDPVTMAQALTRLRRNHGWTVGRMSVRLGMPLDKVETILRTLDAPEPVQQKLKTGKMSLGTFDRFFEGKTGEAQLEILEAVTSDDPDAVVTGEQVLKTVRRKTEERHETTKLPFMADLSVMPDLNVAYAKVQAANAKMEQWTDSTRIAAHEVYANILREVNRALAFLGQAPGLDEALVGDQMQMVGDE